LHGFSIIIYTCEIHTQQIGNVKLDGEDVIKIPTFKCIPDEYTGSMSFFCLYCNELHKHSEGEGIRTSHCTSDSPLIKTGYIVEMLHYDELIEIKESIDSFLEFES
jgi:hypothetical protein